MTADAGWPHPPAYDHDVPTRIRPAADADLDALQGIEDRADRILVELLRPAESWPAPTGAERAGEPGFLLVAEDGEAGALVGFAHVLEVDGLAHLEQVSVPPEHGRRGHGGALVEAAAVEARRRGHRRITLRTFADVLWNAPAYARAGFVEEEPSTSFHRGLVATEARLGLDRLGRRIQMGRELG
jgi:GNAT superfamily N-acetyltransferase